MCGRSRVTRSRSRRDRVMEQMSDKTAGVNANWPSKMDAVDANLT
jgi:hypothetical protein